jgi:pimeloyl-ACP methyl ester carboxylesterase
MPMPMRPFPAANGSGTAPSSEQDGGGGSDAEEESTATTVAACANDVRLTLRHCFLETAFGGDSAAAVGQTAGGPIQGAAAPGRAAPYSELRLVGHSLGGRVALQYCYDAAQAAIENNNPGTASLPGAVPPPPSRLWLLDTVPGTANPQVTRVLQQLEKFLADQEQQQKQEEEEDQRTKPPGIDPAEDRAGGDYPHEHARRRHHHHHHHRLSPERVGRILHGRYGIDVPTARWLASSYRIGAFGFDLRVAQELLRGLPRQKFWDQLEAVVSHRRGARVDLVMAGRNPLWTPDVVRRLEALRDEFPGRLGLHALRDAGHWVHADDLEGLLDVMGSNP